jgi:phospholipid/cholesterol/gamma-HCH transport system substrate-binding protein
MTPLKNNRPVIVGLFIFVGLLIFAITIFTLGGQKKTFVKTYEINAIFNDVSGLLKGGNIWFSGVKIGTVKKITIYGQSQVRVTMSIENDLQSHIHTDSKAKIGSDGLIGSKIIIIYGGTAQAPIVKKNGFIKVEGTLSTDDMMATLQENNKNLLAITADFKSISKKIDSGSGAIGTLINDPAIANNLKSTVAQLQATMVNFKTVSENSKNVMANLQDFSGKINKPGNSINDLASDTKIYSSVTASLKTLENATASVSQFSAKLNKVGESLNQKDNAIGVLLNDQETGNSIKKTMNNLETSSKKLDENLEALQHNIFLRRFFKKKAKEETKAKSDSLQNIAK